ncbi:MAG: enoyl-CoA hydratase/isomerase family protein [Pseudorhodoplanes sp.]
MSEFKTLRTDRDGRVMVITLDRPEAKNAFDHQMTVELGQVWEKVKYDDSISVAVVTGSGDKYFCTGADFREFKDAPKRSQYATRDEADRTLTSKHNKCWKPVITAVNGMVVGGGFHFLTAGDINIASENALFFDTHIEIGLLPVFEPIELMLRLPRETVSRMFLLGREEKMTASRAHELGLVSEVVPPQQLMPRAMQLANALAQRDLTCLMATVELIYKSRELPTTQAIKQGLALREIAGWSVANRSV